MGPQIKRALFNTCRAKIVPFNSHHNYYNHKTVYLNFYNYILGETYNTFFVDFHSYPRVQRGNKLSSYKAAKVHKINT